MNPKLSITLVAHPALVSRYANCILQNTGGTSARARGILRFRIRRHIRTHAIRRAMDLARGLCRDGHFLPLRHSATLA